MRQKGANRDGLIAEIAARQHGVISTRQLLAAGVDASGIRRRKRSSRLHSLHQGVYAVGHIALRNEGRWMAAVLACGDRALLSHRSAAELWRLLPTADGDIRVSVPAVSGRKRRSGIRVHRSRTLYDQHITHRLGIPVTTPARTIADLRRVAPDLARGAQRQAAVIGLHVPEDLGAENTRSELEAAFLRLCRRHRLPMPEVNVRIGPFVVDFLWRERALIVETDGYRYHRGRLAFEDDRARDVELRTRGFEVVRFSYTQVSEDSKRVAEALTAILCR